MTHVSKKQLKKKAYEKISAQFIDTMSGLNRNKELRKFLKEFLTPTERLMLAKRLSIIFMLKSGYPFETIEKTLKVSPATVFRFWKKIKQGSLRSVAGKIQSSGVKKNFLETLEKFLVESAPPPYGKGRWTKTLRHIDKYS